MTDQTDVSKAVVAYLGYGTDASPTPDLTRMWRVVGTAPNAGLASSVEDLVRQVDELQIDWRQHTLATAGEQVVRIMKSGHPELTADALQALAWKFTFDWR